MTTGVAPEGAGRAFSLVTAWRAARAASSATLSSSNNSNPMVWPSESYPVCRPVSPFATAERRKSVRTCSSVARMPSELATRMRRVESL